MVYLFSMIVVGSVCYFVGKYGIKSCVEKVNDYVKKLVGNIKNMNK